MGEVRHIVSQSDGRSITLCVPDDDELALSFRHVGFDDFDDEKAADLVTQVRFQHPVWWRSPYTCTADEHGCCDCGRVSLLEVIEVLRADHEAQQDALDAHMSVTHEAWDHFWSGDQLTSEHPTVNRVCVECLITGRPHLAEVAAEAEDLAAELGTALAAYYAAVKLGRSRYPGAA
jgi:hypothetical protein